MNDHQDSENFSYERSWKEIEDALRDAEDKQNQRLMALRNNKLTRKQKMAHMRAYKALDGVVTSLRWVLGDLKVTRAKMLGDE